jgi:hypothetical protein
MPLHGGDQSHVGAVRLKWIHDLTFHPVTFFYHAASFLNERDFMVRGYFRFVPLCRRSGPLPAPSWRE